MRTTLTLDDDVAKAVAAEARAAGTSYKETVNRLLRRGLAREQRGTDGEPFTIVARDLGSLPGLDHDNVADLLDRAEGFGRR